MATATWKNPVNDEPKRENPKTTEQLLHEGEQGESGSLDELFLRHRERLRHMVRVRLDGRVRRRVDDSDVLQDVYLEASRRMDYYLSNRGVPFFVWLRSLAAERIIQLHRHHLGAEARDVRREVPLDRAAFPQATSAVLAANLLGTMTTASQEFARAELKLKLQEGLESLEPKDREVLSLRHFECLTNEEVAVELGLSKSAASKRYMRAGLKLKKILESMPGGLGAS